MIGEGILKKPLDTYKTLSSVRESESSFTLGGTVQYNPPILAPVAHSTDRSSPTSIVKAIAQINRRVAEVGSSVARKAFPPKTLALQTERQSLVNAPLFGSPNNQSFSSLQVNISQFTDSSSLTESLGAGGQLHADKRDEPFSLTLLICLSDVDAEVSSGEFYLGETREYVILRPFTLLLFHGGSVHGGTIPASTSGSVSEGKRRINLVLYPGDAFMNRSREIRFPCDQVNRVADVSFFKDGEACFGGKANMEL